MNQSTSLFLLALASAGVMQASAAPSFTATRTLEALRAKSRAEGWTFQLKYSPVMERSLNDITGFKVPADWKRQATFVTPVVKEKLPSHFDWREVAGGLTPIKDQGMCGSCWAFGTVGAFEQAVKIRDHVTKSFSEQQLISCNTDGWGCNGGFTAHKYHVSPGAALTDQYPYEAADSSCKDGLTYVNHLESWGWVAGSQEATPTTEAIKKAIYTYGPVAAAVSADDTFQAYGGGVLNSCNTDPVNHLIVLVGWDDKDGAWILRNSWGPSWGENGYMRIQYGCDSVGSYASFVQYKPTCTPQPLAQTGVDVTIHKGQSVKLGSAAVSGQTYEWSPATGLDNAHSANPVARPSVTTDYTLKTTTSCGTAEKMVRVSVN